MADRPRGPRQPARKVDLKAMAAIRRAILASVLSPRQDLTAYLIVLRAAVEAHGAPEALVSDSGSIFKAKQAMAIYQALGIRKEAIDQGQPWQNYRPDFFSSLLAHSSRRR